MKKIALALLSSLLIIRCSVAKLDMNAAKETVENCLKAIDKGDYAAVKSTYYSTEFVQSESEEKLAEKFNKLKEVTGKMQSYELKESKVESEAGEEECIKLVYDVKYERVTTHEDFVIIIEGGKHKIASHLVSNQ